MGRIPGSGEKWDRFFTQEMISAESFLMNRAGDQASESADRKEDQMNRTQASRAWEVSEKDVETICKEMGIDADSIPDDTVPVYVPDRMYEADPHRYYIYLLDVISNTHMEIKGIDQNILETCVAQLKEKKLIIPKRGAAPDSLDYHDYLISPERALYNEWYNYLMKDGMSLIDKILSFFKK